jgi:GNAT superfamily N-acetyltransferase
MTTVRAARVQDAPAMGRVHVRAWQAAYRGQMPDEYLDGLRAEQRAEYWTGVLERGPGQTTVLVAEEPPEGVVVGFAALGPAGGQPDAEDGELYVINVDPDYWGGGASRALLEAAQAALARLGYREAVLWVLPGNARARRFYERAGWVADDAKRTVEVHGAMVEEVRYRRRLP